MGDKSPKSKQKAKKLSDARKLQKSATALAKQVRAPMKQPG